MSEIKKPKSPSVKEIIEIQKELCKLGVFEVVKDYKLSSKYFNEFLDKYQKRQGRFGYIQESIIIPLLRAIEASNPYIQEEDAVRLAQKYYPVIKCMMIHEKVFSIIDKIKKGKIKPARNGK